MCILSISSPVVKFYLQEYIWNYKVDHVGANGILVKGVLLLFSGRHFLVMLNWDLVRGDKHVNEVNFSDLWDLLQHELLLTDN